MSDSYHYEDGAIHNDHKRVLHIDKVQGADLQQLIRGFFMEDAEDAEIVDEEVEVQTALQQKIVSCFTEGLLNVKDTSRLYFLLLVMWARRQLQSKEIPSFVRMVGKAHPALFDDGRTQEKVITDLQNMNKKLNIFFDEYVKDQATLIEYVDKMYPKKKNGERSKYGEEAVCLTNKLFLAMK